MATGSETQLVDNYGPYGDFTVLELGSAHSHSETLRKRMGAKSHTGVDMREAPTVDIVHNMNYPLDIEPVDVVLCFSMLEHCDKPWLVAENINRVLKKDGLLLLSVPFQWRVHGYPDDYFRYTPNGVKSLFPGIKWFAEYTDPKKIDVHSHTNGQVLLLFAGRKI